MTHLSPQITHLVNARPMSVTMGNAIRQLKLDISGSDIDLPEQDVSFFHAHPCIDLSIDGMRICFPRCMCMQAKDALCQKIDDYIRDKIIIADEVIQDIAGKKIKDGDIVLTYGRCTSSLCIVR
jgi:translation initiation factor eIF-2B subunit delta